MKVFDFAERTLSDSCPEIIPRFPVSRRYISEVSAMGETDPLSVLECVVCAWRNHLRDLPRPKLRIL
jgi:hypothetical protein